MKNITHLKCEINELIVKQGQTPDWERSRNPAGHYLRTGANGFRLLILDSAIEDNLPDRILEALQPLLLVNINHGNRWILDSKLNLRAEQ